MLGCVVDGEEAPIASASDVHQQYASSDAQSHAYSGLRSCLAMRTTVTLDDALLAQAQALCGELERSALLREALQALVQRESARRLAALGGSEPALKPIPRRRSAA